MAKKEIALERDLERDRNTEDTILRKPIFFVDGIYKINLVQQKVLYLALLKIQNGEYATKNAHGKETSPWVKFDMAELIRTLGYKGGSIYETLQENCVAMLDLRIGFQSLTEKNIRYYKLITDTFYINRANKDTDHSNDYGGKAGTLILQFNPSLKDFLLTTNLGYTKIKKSIAMDFENPYSMRLYEILRKECLHRNRVDTGNVFTLEISESILRLKLGLVNIEEHPELAWLQSEEVTYKEEFVRRVENIVSQIETQKYKSQFCDFKRYCIDRAQTNINENTDITFTYSVKKRNKIRYITFFITKEENDNDIDVIENNPEVLLDRMISSEEIKPSNSDLFSALFNNLAVDFMAYAVSDYFKNYPGITKKDIKTILIYAGLNQEIVKEAVQRLDETSEEVSNVTGWLIACIENGCYRQSVSKKDCILNNSLPESEEK
ncbi:MAG: replication initiation protein [Eubacterium sp.]|nr:replication initiation protein [Eubacterium sp.]